MGFSEGQGEVGGRVLNLGGVGLCFWRVFG